MQDGTLIRARALVGKRVAEARKTSQDNPDETARRLRARTRHDTAFRDALARVACTDYAKSALRSEAVPEGWAPPPFGTAIASDKALVALETRLTAMMGVDRLPEHWWDEWLDRVADLEWAIARTPAEGIAGIAVKLRRLRYSQKEGEAAWDGLLARTALGAVERDGVDFNDLLARGQGRWTTWK